MLVNEFADFTSTLTDQCNNVDFSKRVTGDHAKQCTFADAATGKDSNALTTSHGKHAVYAAHPSLQHIADTRARKWVERVGFERPVFTCRNFRQTIQWLAEGINNAAQ